MQEEQTDAKLHKPAKCSISVSCYTVLVTNVHIRPTDNAPLEHSSKAKANHIPAKPNPNTIPNIYPQNTAKNHIQNNSIITGTTTSPTERKQNKNSSTVARPCSKSTSTSKAPIAIVMIA